MHVSTFSEKIFSYSNQFSYISNFEPGDSHSLGEIASLHRREGIGLLHLCSPYRDHRFLKPYSYVGQMPPRKPANSTEFLVLNGVISGANTMLESDFVRRKGWWLVTSDATILSTFFAKELSIEVLWSN